MKRKILLMSLPLQATLAFAATSSEALPEPATWVPQIPDSLEHVLNPVVVTGTNIHQRLTDTPVPVQVITAAELRNADLNGMEEALTMMVPNLSFSPNAMGSYLRMNGLTNSHVVVLLNGRKLTGDISGNVDLSQIDINLVKRIEVLNGAASTLYGSDAVGGVINIITVEPESKTEFNSNTSYRNHNRLDQSHSMLLRAGNVGSLTSYTYSHSDGWQNSNLTESGDEFIPSIAQLSLGYTTNNFTQKFTWEPSAKLKLYADGTYYNKLLDRPVTRPDITGGTNYNTFSESFSWAAGGSYSLGDLGVISLDYNGRRYSQWYKYMMPVDDFLPGDYYKTKRQDFNDITGKGVFNFTENGNTLFGLDYRRERLDRPESDLDKSLGTLSVFGQHEQRFMDHLTLLAGLRYDWHEEIGSRLTPKASLMYHIGNFSARGTYAMGYRAPGIDELYYHMLKPMGSRHIITFGNRDLKAEDSNYASLNLEYRDSWFSVAVTGYMNFVKNMVTSRSTKFTALDKAAQQALIEEFPEIHNIKTSTLTIKEYYNFQKAHVKGIEANVTVLPMAGLTLSLNYCYAHGRGLNNDGNWQRLNRSVMHSGTFTANYTKRWNFYTLDANLNGRVQSKTYYPGDADGDAPGYGIWNLTTRHTFNCFRGFSLTAGLGIDNIFNRRDMRPLNKNFALYSPGRSFVVSLAVKLK